MFEPNPGVVELLVINLASAAWMLVATVGAHPFLTLLVTGWTLATAAWGATGFLGFAAVLTFGACAWRRLHRRSWLRFATSPWRAAWVYRRRWQPAMVTCRLAVRVNDREFVPEILTVRSTAYVDRVLVQLLVGQAPEEFEAWTSQLGHTFEALRVKVVADRPGRIWLEFTHKDPLQGTITALQPQEGVDLEALPVGRLESGQPWKVRLLGSHLLIAGATGSGKGSVLWSLVRALGPAVRDGRVQLWAVDPKGGMELTPGSAMFARFAYESPAVMVELLEDAVSYMRMRTELLRLAGSRALVPSVEDPLIVVVVDEMAALTAYVGDRELKRRAETALQLLLSQGRAPGVLVVAAAQDPGKDVIGFRDLFPSRIALRLLEDVQVDMVLGRSARQRGALCDQIPASMPGVAYVAQEGVREPVRVRAAYVSDADLAEMVRIYTPTPRLKAVEQARS
ncbi:MAG TPA: FtsK/SpoIIIE domain-containing protein [Nocardioidaceae bacterium]|nr:FtsK/SpoIIIE domain-containing protein [Nocardioidaceae bacterium]